MMFVGGNQCIFAIDDNEIIVQKIQIQGNQTVDEQVILNNIRTKVGRIFSKADGDEDIKHLYDLGYFSNIALDIEPVPGGVSITFLVQEKPVLTEILFEGNKKIKLKPLKKLVESKSGSLINEAQIVADVAAIKDYYESKGYEAAVVDYDLTIDEINRSAIVRFKIKEDSRFKIKEIKLIGNQSIKSKKIKKVMKTKEKAFFRKGIFRSEQFDDDLNRILAYYRSKGFIDIEIQEHSISYPEAGLIAIEIKLQEGSQYEVGQIMISGNETFPTDDILKRVPLKGGEIFTPQDFKKSRSAIQDYYMEKGYIDVVVKTSTVLDEETGRLNLNFAIIEKHISYVDQIRITGNTKTKDIVIRRELNIYPGEVFDGVRVRRSQERLLNTGFFKNVQMDIEPSAEDDLKNLIVSVDENKTGELGFGVGFSSIDNLIGFVEISQKNFDIFNWPTFTGDGQKLRFKSTFGAERQDFVLSFTEPWFLGQQLSLGFDLYRRESRFLSDVYDETRTGFDTRLGKRLGEFTRGDLVYRLEESEITDVADDASDAIKAEEGQTTVSSLEFSVTRDTRDNLFLPTRGMKNQVSVEYAGGFLGFDRDFWKLHSRNSIYFPLPYKTILRFTGQVGVVDTHGDSEEVSIFERFFLGGANTIRGFDFRDVGPKDELGEPIGGRSMIAGSAEYSFPIVTKVRGAFFYDVGNVYTDFGQFDLNDLRQGVGVGVRLELPIGPVRLDWGYPIDRDEFTEEKGRFDFNIGYSF